MSIFNLSADPAVAMKKDKRGKNQPIASINMDSPVKSTPIMAHNVLYIASMNYLFAIQKDAK